MKQFWSNVVAAEVEGTVQSSTSHLLLELLADEFPAPSTIVQLAQS